MANPTHQFWWNHGWSRLAITRRDVLVCVDREELAMSDTFAELYGSTLKEVFTAKAQKDLEQGVDGLARARTYAEQGKPEFVLAYLLLIDETEEVKRELLAYAYEQRAVHSEHKAEEFDQKFHRPFPLIKLEAQKDRLAARQVRQGKRIHTGTTKMPLVN